MSNNRVTLIVDDSNAIRSALSNLIESLFNCEVIEASDGVEALSILSKRSDIEIAFVDYEMPNMNGEELVRKIRSTYSERDIKLCMLTGKFGGDDLEEFVTGPYVDSFIHKPLDPDIIETTFKTLMADPIYAPSFIHFATIETRFAGIILDEERRVVMEQLSEFHASFITRSFLLRNKVIRVRFEKLSEILGEEIQFYFKVVSSTKIGNGLYKSIGVFVGLSEGHRQQIRTITIRGARLDENSIVA